MFLGLKWRGWIAVVVCGIVLIVAARVIDHLAGRPWGLVFVACVVVIVVLWTRNTAKR